MSKLVKIFIVIIALVGVILTVFYGCFAIGMIHTNSAQPITTRYSKEYKTDLRKSFPGIQDINIFYKQGRIYFNFAVNSEMSLEECKQVVRKTRDVLQDKIIMGFFPKGHGMQNSIMIKFDNKKDMYSFYCPYFIPAEDVNHNSNNSIANNYKVWFMSINNHPSIQIEF